jgi:hypothetical protein
MKVKINKEIKDYRNECGDCEDGGQDCYRSSISTFNDQRRAKATCKRCQCLYCTRATCPPAVANQTKEMPDHIQLKAGTALHAGQAGYSECIILNKDTTLRITDQNDQRIYVNYQSYCYYVLRNEVQS